MSAEPSTFSKLIRTATLPLIAGIMVAILCWIACGVTLGLFFAGLALTAILLPRLSARDARLGEALLIAASVVDGIALIWLIAALMHLSLLEWLQSYILLIAVAMALLGMVTSLRRLIGPSAAAAGTTIVFFAWLAWPVWLSPWADARIVALLAPVHPLLVMNRVFIELGIWTQQPLMYQLTSLGQDVAYELPQSILPCVLLHLLMGLALGLPAWWWPQPEASPARPTEASPAA
jgi:hypothetical protein